MSEINWGYIRSGATFESLVHSLVLFEDPNAFLFSRPGKDRGQDARSGDGRIVYQAKFHQNGSAADVRRDAKKEASKIAEYRSEPIWKDVTEWILVTNVGFNPQTDDRAWNEEIDPLFQELGLIASYWEKAELETRLHQYPDLKQAYFGGENRVFLSLSEAREMLRKQDFHPVTLDADYQGRAEAIETFENFFEEEDRAIAIVHGAGGVGKTRFLLESAEHYLRKEKPDNTLNKKWQIFWANTATMERSNSWFAGVIPERPTLLLIDEPEDRKLFDMLLEQLNIRGNQWKVLIAIRSPKDIVLGYLQQSRQRKQIEEIQLEPLREDPAKAFCLNLFELGNLRSQDEKWKEDTANWIVNYYDRYPAFIALAVNLLEKTGELKDFPQKSKHLLRQYLKEITSVQSHNYSAEQVFNTLRWIALFRKINTEDKEIINFIQSQVQYKSSSTLLHCLRDLAKRNVLFKSGSYDRFLEIKPDIFRDYILKEWFIVSVDFGRDRQQISEEALELCQYLSQEPLEAKEIKKAILQEIARFEFRQRQYGEKIDILARFFAAIRTNLSGWSVREKLAVINLLHEVAFNRVEDILNLCDRLLESSSEKEQIETIFGKQTLTHDNVILALPWLIYQAVPCAEQKTDQDRIVDILCKLAIRENEIASRLNKDLSLSDHHAKDILSKIIKEEESFLGSFSRSAFKKAQQILGEIRKNQNIQEQKLFLDILLKPLLSLDREYTFFDGKTVTFNRSVILPDSDRWNERNQLQTTIETILEERSLNSSQSVHLWDLLNEAHDSANCAFREAEKHQNLKNYSQDFYKQVKQDLTWVLKFLTSNQVDISELQAARKIWDWHFRFEQKCNLKELANQCESIFTQNKLYSELYSEYEPLVRMGSFQERIEKAEDKAEELSKSQNTKIIKNFVQNGVLYLVGSSQNISILFPVAYRLGLKANNSEIVRDFVRESLQLETGDPIFQFSLQICINWLEDTRTRSNLNNPQEAALVFQQLLDTIQDNEGKIVYLTYNIYQNAWSSQSSVTEQELNVILDKEQSFIQHSQIDWFIEILSGIIFTDISRIKKIIEQNLDRLDEKSFVAGIRILLFNLYHAIMSNSEHSDRYSLGQWVLEQILKLPQIEDIGGNRIHFLKDIIKLTEKPDLQWLVDAVKKRLQQFNKSESSYVRILPNLDRLSLFIKQLSEEELMSEHAKSLILELLSLGQQNYPIFRSLPQYLQDIDPKGIIVPSLVVQKLSDSKIEDNLKQIYLWSRIAAVYPENSSAWRTIAHQSCALANNFDDRDRNDIFNALANSNPKIGFRNIGEVLEIYEIEFNLAHQRLKEESDPVLVPFREWVLKIAEAELKDQRERVKEELWE
ncbi:MULTISPECIES: hypothetical protein [Spirulina sp. CCY15215]|uniref:hypothetical protein n=1 Tax=Spirulina sp. CCY15215 TaxID=2767591 RepID=UPI0019529FDF|nr:hypothetical protein [Spirulina major]